MVELHWGMASSAGVFLLLIAGEFPGVFALVVGEFPEVFVLVVGEFPGVFSLVVGEFPIPAEDLLLFAGED